MTEEKAKTSKSAKTAETPSAEPARPTEEDVLSLMRKLRENGITEFTSRLISDKLGFADPDRGRQRVRTLMGKLEADGKVISEKKAVNEKGARKRYVYRLKT